MGKYNLTKRQCDIIFMILDNENLTITISEIAKKLELSSRTVQRDIPFIEEWFENNDFNLVKKPGVGLSIEENKEMQDLIRELLKIEKVEKNFQKEDRYKFILTKILSTNEPLKYYVFTEYLNISDKTLVQDLDYIKSWLSNYDIELVRKPGEGVFVEGNEKSIRNAQVNLIYENLDDNLRLNMIKNISKETTLDFIKENDVLSLINIKTIDKIRKVLFKIFKDFDVSLSDNSYVALLVHISLAIERIKTKGIDNLNDFDLSKYYNTREYIFAKKIVEELEIEFCMEIPDSEIFYISMHIKGTNIISSEENNDNIVDVLNVNIIVKRLVEYMQNIFEVDLKSDRRLEKDLKNHIMPAINRLKMGMKIRNPILEEVRTKYFHVYDALDYLTKKVIDENNIFEDNILIPEDEIGYLTIHFASAIERKFFNDIKINVITSCPTGIGTSKLLETKLESYFSNILIKGNISIFDLKYQFLKDENIDLIVSTVKLENLVKDNILNEFDYIEVNAIPSEEDVSEIRKKIKNIAKKKAYKNAYQKLENIKNEHIDFSYSKKTENKYEKNNEKNVIIKTHNKNHFDINFVRDFYSISTEFYDIYKSIKYFEFDKLDYNYDVFSLCAKEVALDKNEFLLLEESFNNRAKINSPYFLELSLYLVHCKVDISKPKLAFGRLNEDSIIVMCLSINSNNYINELFSLISQSVIEDKYFLENIKTMNEQEINNKVMNKIEQIIQKEINKKIKED